MQQESVSVFSPKYISFDLDGTLADNVFDARIWNEEIPRAFAEKNGITLEAAKTIVYAEYYRAQKIENAKHWTDIAYWCGRLRLDNYPKILDGAKAHISIYEDVVETLEALSKKFPLIIVSNAEDKFLKSKIEVNGIRTFFTRTFSSSHFGTTKKNRKVFEAILKELRLQPNELLHVGDDHHMDYEVPTSLKIPAFFLDRSGEMKEKHIIHSLAELKKFL